MSNGIRKLAVLGSGGSRIATITQRRRTGGLVVLTDDGYIIIDPGPGSIAAFNQLGLDPSKVMMVLVSHRHIDHYTDSEVYIEAMTDGGNKKVGVLGAGKSVLEHIGEEVPAISSYHRSLPSRVLVLTPHDQFEEHEISVRAIYARHYDPHTIGFRIASNETTIAYLPDTEYTDDLIEGIKNAQLLILSVLRPGGEKFSSHLCIDEAVELARKARPEKVLLTHFGTKMIMAPPEREARKFESVTGIETIAARDSMILNLSGKASDKDKSGLDLYT